MNNIGKADLDLLKKLHPHDFSNYLKKLENHYPIQYLIGYVDFYNTKINVNENVLIPRFETELLIEKTLTFLHNHNYHTLLDLGTGSGAIAIALKKHCNLEIEACDISPKALSLAKTNAHLNNTQVTFFKLDILNEIPQKKYDCIISNPPYVSYDEIVSPETKYEPALALYAHNHGLAFYERILSTAHFYLNEHGSLIFEIGATQALAIKKIALTYFPHAQISIVQDFNNFDRFLFITT